MKYVNVPILFVHGSDDNGYDKPVTARTRIVKRIPSLLIVVS